MFNLNCFSVCMELISLCDYFQNLFFSAVVRLEYNNCIISMTVMEKYLKKA